VWLNEYRTIAVEPTKGGEFPSFIVNDLSKDERFNELSFVTGSPFLRFYAGVPLITKRGIPIGSLFIVDDRVWDGLSKETIHFMGTMATTIMKHLEMAREVEEHRRGMKMSRGLASFVEGRSQLIEAEADADDGEGTKIAGQFETDIGIGRTRSKAGSTKESIHSVVGSVSSVECKEKEFSAALLKTEERIMAHDIQTGGAQSMRPVYESGSQSNSFGGTSISVLSPPIDPTENVASPADTLSEGSTMKVLFSRAANLIREAFEVDGGAVFYDAQRGFGDLQKPGSPISPKREDSQDATGDELPSSSEFQSDPDDKSPDDKGNSSGLGEGMFSRSSAESKKLVEVLGFSTARASSIHGDEYPGPHSFTPFPEKALHTLLSRYPRGKLWTFDSDGAVSSSSEEEIFETFRRDPTQRALEVQKQKKKSARAKSDAKFLLRHFPGVRQLLFVPLWDAGRSRWLAGCCAWSTEPTRILSKQSELAFLSAFGNSVMAECSRIDTEIADQKKGDFIGSISHELRSPLHGILASAEFLGEESLTGFEKGLVETIDSCGRTLLDTINHILDFSKINHFEKNWRKNKRGGSRPTPTATKSALALRQSDLPMINLFADVDISVVCEEVVESVFAGHVFQNVTAQSFDMVPNSKGKMSDNKSYLTERIAADHVKHPEVAVILDVDMQNYHFTTQPGAFRRVIMNLLGNALKYTSHGYVRVRLDATEIEDLHTPGSGDTVARSMVTVTVTDTGKGISSEFLRSKLFTPFAQENSLSSGTGLGLSIVRSIVALLEGEITIDSELGRGTRKLNLNSIVCSC
jgi:signal transduction histidine kinase